MFGKREYGEQIETMPMTESDSCPTCGESVVGKIWLK